MLMLGVGQKMIQPVGKPPAVSVFVEPGNPKEALLTDCLQVED